MVPSPMISMMICMAVSLADVPDDDDDLTNKHKEATDDNKNCTNITHRVNLPQEPSSSSKIADTQVSLSTSSSTSALSTSSLPKRKLLNFFLLFFFFSTTHLTTSTEALIPHLFLPLVIKFAPSDVRSHVCRVIALHFWVEERYCFCCSFSANFILLFILYNYNCLEVLVLSLEWQLIFFSEMSKTELCLASIFFLCSFLVCCFLSHSVRSLRRVLTCT